VHMIKLQDHFLLTSKRPVGVKQDLHSFQASGKSHKQRPLMFHGLGFSRSAWTPRIRCHLPSVWRFPEASDSHSEVVQFAPRRATEPKVGFPTLGGGLRLRFGCRFIF